MLIAVNTSKMSSILVFAFSSPALSITIPPLSIIIKRVPYSTAYRKLCVTIKVGGQAVLGRQGSLTTPWLTERHGYDPTYDLLLAVI